jgi:hypothetical protein
VSDGIRTHDRLDHNQELYQLSYAHRGKLNLPLPPPRIGQELINNIFWPPVLFPGPAPVAQLDRATAF